MINTQRRCWGGVTSLALLACATAARAFAQDIPQRMAYGIEIAFRSGHADRGFIINDRPVVQPVMWFSGSGTQFSVWSSFALAQTTDDARPQIVELELTREQTHTRARTSSMPVSSPTPVSRRRSNSAARSARAGRRGDSTTPTPKSPNRRSIASARRRG